MVGQIIQSHLLVGKISAGFAAILVTYRNFMHWDQRMFDRYDFIRWGSGITRPPKIIHITVYQPKSFIQSFIDPPVINIFLWIWLIPVVSDIGPIAELAPFFRCPRFSSFAFFTVATEMLHGGSGCGWLRSWWAGGLVDVGWLGTRN